MVRIYIHIFIPQCESCKLITAQGHEIEGTLGLEALSLKWGLVFCNPKVAF